MRVAGPAKYPNEKQKRGYMLNPNTERAAQNEIESENYASESLLDDPEFVPEIATPQEVQS